MQVTTLPMITHKVSIFLVYCASSLCLSVVSTMIALDVDVKQRADGS
jgi:hypothetical protein